ncbi:MAG: multicopper oxidase family protein [Patescibacteria group bacterium]
MTKIWYVLGALVLIGFGYLLSQAALAPRASASQIVELTDGDTYDLTASVVTKEINGVTHDMLAYNGSIPGPLIKVEQGAEVTINFTNEVGMSTLLHSHGVRMDNAFDGSQTSQEEIKSGESFSYKLTFPDAGVYWYHPHVREDYQQELGLYGAFVVEPSDSSYLPPVNREEVVFLDDILIEGENINLSKAGADHTLMGRFGNVMLVNGGTDYVLQVVRGEVVRLYLVNSANARPFNFAIQGAQMKLVGGDNGVYERSTFVDSVTLGPSERAIVDVLVTEPTTLVNDTPTGLTALGSIAVTDGPLEKSYAAQFNTLQMSPQVSASIDPYRQYVGSAPDKTISLTVDMMGGMMSNMGGHMMPDGTTMGGMNMGGLPEGGIEWEDTDMQMMNEMSNADMVKWRIIDQDTGRKDMDIDWAFKKGEPVKIRIFNDPKSMHPMQHPIHFHGQRFLVVARDDLPQTNLVWKDTVLVKAGETVDIILDTSNPGTWMAHCHIAEHLESGMMMTFKVE